MRILIAITQNGNENKVVEWQPETFVNNFAKMS